MQLFNLQVLEAQHLPYLGRRSQGHQVLAEAAQRATGLLLELCLYEGAQVATAQHSVLAEVAVVVQHELRTTARREMPHQATR